MKIETRIKYGRERPQDTETTARVVACGARPETMARRSFRAAAYQFAARVELLMPAGCTRVEDLRFGKDGFSFELEILADNFEDLKAASAAVAQASSVFVRAA